MNRTGPLLASLALISSLASATPSSSHLEIANVEDNWRSWSQVGEAQLSVFFFDIYQSSLLSPNGDYHLDFDLTPHPLALSITYQRNVSQRQLIDATQEQWLKLGYERSVTANWLGKLETIFPDISKGDQLTYATNGETGKFYFSEQHSTSDYSKNVVIGEIEDETLNDAFLAIWLSPKTEYPKLRQRLIGRVQ